MRDEDTATCWQMQCEEIEVLKSIYGDLWKVDQENSNSSSIDIVENGKTVSFFITLPDTYPLGSPPLYTISAPDLSKDSKDEIENVLNSTYLDNIGESVLYQWVENVRDFLLNLNSDLSVNKEPALTYVPIIEDNIMISELPSVIHGNVITDRKSAFQGHAARVHSEKEAKLVLSTLKENKKINNATHNIYAYRIARNSNSFIQNCEDDGEAQAGSRLLHLLKIMNVEDVIIVVSRWYGGIHLGPDRFRHINNAARQVLEQAQFLSSSSTTDKKTKGS